MRRVKDDDEPAVGSALESVNEVADEQAVRRNPNLFAAYPTQRII